MAKAILWGIPHRRKISLHSLQLRKGDPPMNRKQKAGLVALILALVFFAASALSAEFLGSKNSNKYHYPTCRWAQKIKPSNLVKFSTPEEAVKAGYVPCKVCNPPFPSK
jgi:hypothetical protein